MRLFKRSSPPPAQLLRLSVLEEGVETSGSTARLSLPSGVSECCLEDLMAGTEAPKSRRGFPFPWLSRKHSAPKKYAVNPSASESEAAVLMRSAISQLSLADCSPQTAFYKQPPAKVHYFDEIPYNDAFLSNESLDNHDYLNNNNNVIGNDPAMYRSVSTSALFDDPKRLLVRSVDIDMGSLHHPHTSSCDDLIDRCEEETPGGGSCGGKSAISPQQLGTVVEEVFLERGGTGEFERHQSGNGDNESLASSIQHRSDESGYESDGTKNGCEENPTAIQDAVLKGGAERDRFHSLDSNVHKFAALFQRLTNSGSAEVKKDETSSPTFEARSLRLRTPAMLSNFVQRHTTKTPAAEDAKKETKNGPSKIGQFKAWTLDRKLLRSRWKKSSLPEDKISIPIPSRRSSIFQSSLFPSSLEDSPVTPRQLETKSLPSLSSVSSTETLRESPLNSDSLSNCGGLNYQLRLKKAGYKSASLSNNARRRLWLQSQLSDSEDALSPEQSVTKSPSLDSDAPRRLPSQLDMHELVSVDLEKDEHGELGIYITGCNDAERNVLGYIIMDLEAGGPAERSGRLLKGDELLMVNGQQLQGVSLEEARRMLRVPEADMHLLLARELPDELCLKEAALPPVPELHESCVPAPPRLRHWTSDVSSYRSDRLSNPDLPQKPLVDNERMGSNGICTLPRRPKCSQLLLHTVVFEKGPGRKSLGFSIVGGKDSPKGELGFYVKTIFANGQAAETSCLKEGDEIYTLNGQSLQGLSHSEAIAAFKKIKQGPVILHIGRRTSKKSVPTSDTSSKLENNNNSKSCSTLDNI